MRHHASFVHLAVLLPVLAIRASVSAQHETPGDPYMPLSAAVPAVSPAYHFWGTHFFATQVNVDADGNNILGDAANEPSIAVDPNNPDRMAIGWRQFDNVSSNFRQAGFGYTTDGGMHWTFPGVVIQPGIFRSDPVLASDSDGRFYYNSLSIDSEFVCTVFRSTGDGTWDDGTFAYGGDKAWMTVDRTPGPGNGHIYSNWSINFGVSGCDNTGNFTRSTDGGDSYETCIATQPSVYWGSCDVGPTGTCFVAGSDGYVARTINAENAGPIGWKDPVYVELEGQNGSEWNGQHPNPAGLVGQRWIAVNHAQGPLLGQVYVLQSVAPYTMDDPAEVMFSRSDDGGNTWSPAVRINDDADGPAWQWFGTMSVAPNGRIDVVWLDTRDYPGSVLSALYYSNSLDGGLTWSPNERLSEAFDPHVGWPNQEKMGDYFHMISDNTGAHLAWSGTFNGEQDVYYGHIELDVSGTHAPGVQSAASVLQNTPNPFSDRTAIHYLTGETGRVRMMIFNQTGIPVRLLCDKVQTPGGYTLWWDGRDDNGDALPGSVYYCALMTEKGVARFIKMLLMK